MEKYIQKAYDNSDIEWKKAAHAALDKVARRQLRLTTDDVYRAMPTGVSTHEPRAMGGVIRAAQSEGTIINTGKYEKSTRGVNHKRPLSVWESTVFN